MSCSGATAFPGTPDSVATLDFRGLHGSVLALRETTRAATVNAYEISWLENQHRYIARLASAHVTLSDLEAMVTSLAPVAGNGGPG